MQGGVGWGCGEGGGGCGVGARWGGLGGGSRGGRVVGRRGGIASGGVAGLEFAHFVGYAQPFFVGVFFGVHGVEGERGSGSHGTWVKLRTVDPSC